MYRQVATLMMMNHRVSGQLFVQTLSSVMELTPLVLYYFFPIPVHSHATTHVQHINHEGIY